MKEDLDETVYEPVKIEELCESVVWSVEVLT